MKTHLLDKGELTPLSVIDLVEFRGGVGPIGEALEWYYKTVGSFYRGLWDGLTGADPKL